MKKKTETVTVNREAPARQAFCIPSFVKIAPRLRKVGVRLVGVQNEPTNQAQLIDTVVRGSLETKTVFQIAKAVVAHPRFSVCFEYASDPDAFNRVLNRVRRHNKTDPLTRVIKRNIILG